VSDAQAAAPTLRLDKWLWQARFFKTRSLAAKVVQSGAVRIDGTRVTKPAHALRPGDTLTFAQARRIRVVTVVLLGDRRGPAAEAQTLYDDLSPPPDPSPAAAPRTGPPPSKKERRELDRIRGIPT